MFGMFHPVNAIDNNMNATNTTTCTTTTTHQQNLKWLNAIEGCGRKSSSITGTTGTIGNPLLLKLFPSIDNTL